MGLNQMRHWDFLLIFLFLRFLLVAPSYLLCPGYFRMGKGAHMENRCCSWTIQLWSLWTVLPWELATAGNCQRSFPRAVSLQLHTKPASKSVVLKGDAWEKDIRKDMQMGKGQCWGSVVWDMVHSLGCLYFPPTEQASGFFAVVPISRVALG